MTKIRIDRLKKLANHLIKGKLGHTEFNFSVLHELQNHRYGTMGCAMGELPIVFPKYWGFDGSGVKYEQDSGLGSDVTSFFGINYLMHQHLFTPYVQIPNLYGGKHLTEKATAKQVGNNILAFIKLMSKYKSLGESEEALPLQSYGKS